MSRSRAPYAVQLGSLQTFSASADLDPFDLTKLPARHRLLGILLEFRALIDTGVTTSHVLRDNFKLLTDLNMQDATGGFRPLTGVHLVDLYDTLVLMLGARSRQFATSTLPISSTNAVRQIGFYIPFADLRLKKATDTAWPTDIFRSGGLFTGKWNSATLGGITGDDIGGTTVKPWAIVQPVDSKIVAPVGACYRKVQRGATLDAPLPPGAFSDIWCRFATEAALEATGTARLLLDGAQHGPQVDQLSHRIIQLGSNGHIMNGLATDTELETPAIQFAMALAASPRENAQLSWRPKAVERATVEFFDGTAAAFDVLLHYSTPYTQAYEEAVKAATGAVGQGIIDTLDGGGVDTTNPDVFFLPRKFLMAP